jgi:hypothetical protein
VIAIDVLARLACDDLDGDDERQAEEHVLGCTECARTLERLLLVGGALRDLVARGDHRVRVPATRSLVDRLEAAGLVTRRYVLAPGSTVPCTVGADDIYMLVSYQCDLAGADRVDVEIGGQRIVDVPFDRARDHVAFVTPAAALRGIPSGRLTVRVVALDRERRERTAGDYVLDHTAFVPAPDPGV